MDECELNGVIYHKGQVARMVYNTNTSNRIKVWITRTSSQKKSI